jgi:alpha-tubulin suppressor-like RCC1 family protein
MEKINRLCIRQILVLKHYFQSSYSIHYPIELVQIIILFYYKLFKIKICCGTNDLIILLDAEVYTWKKDLHSQRIPITFIGQPQKLDLPAIVNISCSYHSLDSVIALSTNGLIYVWGDNCYGQLGIIPSEKDVPLSCNDFLSEKLPNTKKIFTRSYRSMALTYSGEVYSWGSNIYSQLGYKFVNYTSCPNRVALPNIKKLACGENYSLALTDSGEVWGWGSNKYWQLKNGESDIPVISYPQKLPLQNVHKIFCGDHSSMAITKLNEIYVWGRNSHCELGLGHSRDIWIPNEVRDSSGTKSPQWIPTKLDLPNIKKIISTSAQSMALSWDGEIYVWGISLYEPSRTPQPYKLDLPKIKKISCGNGILVAITEINEIYVWDRGHDYPPQKFTF